MSIKRYPETHELFSSIVLLLSTQHESGRLFFTRDPEPKALFYHLNYVTDRIRGIRIILERIEKENTKLAAQHRQLETGDDSIFRKMMISAPPLLTLDTESLYIFGNMVLGQWAYAIAYVRNLPSPQAYKDNKTY